MPSTGTVTPDITTLPFGTIVSFRSKNANDTTLWTGELVARGEWRAYRWAGAQTAYNEAVRQTDPSVPEDYTTLSYFTITLTNNGQEVDTLFAAEWIAPNSLQVLVQDTVQTVIVNDPYGDSDRLLNGLRSLGYSAKLSTS